MTIQKKLFHFISMGCKKPAALLFLLFVSLNVFAQPTSPPDTLKAYQLYKKGHTLMEDAKYDSSSLLIIKAAQYYQSANRWSRVAECFNLLSSNFRTLSKLDSAETYAQKALEILEKESLETYSEKAKAYNNLGLIKTERSEFGQAITQFQKGLDISEKPSVPVYIEAMLLGNLGSVYDDQGSFDKALEYYSKGTSLLRMDGPRKHKMQLAKLYNYTGITYKKKGLFDQALQFYERELEMNLQLYGDSHPSVAGGYNNIGGIYYRNGDIGEAIIYFKKAASSTEQIFGKTHPRVGLIYNNIGACYFETGDYSKAVEYLGKAAEIKRETQGAEHPDLALTYNNIGSIYTEMEKYEQAIDYLQKSLEIRKKVLGENHPVLSNNYNSLGLLYLNTDDPGQAITYFEKELAISEQSRGKQHPFVAEAHTNLAKAYREKGNFSEALANLRIAEESLSRDREGARFSSDSKLNLSFRYPNYAINVLREKGKTQHMQYTGDKDIGHLKSALTTYTNLSKLLDGIQLEFQNEESKLLMGAKSHQIYEEAIQVSYDLYKTTENDSYLDKIFFFFEKSKSRVILELLNRQQGKKFVGVPDSLLTYENNLRQKLSGVQQTLQTSLGNSDNSFNESLLQDSLFTLHQRLNAHLEFIKKRYPRYHAFKYRSEVPPLSQVSQSLSQRKRTLLEYFYGKNSSWALIANANEVKVVSLPHLSGLPEKVTAFNKAIAQKQDSVYLCLGHELYQALFNPLEGQLGSNPLLVVPDGPLNLLPFDALLSNSAAKSDSFTDLPYLLNKYSISYTPSVSLSFFFDSRVKQSYPEKFIGFAPVFSGMNRNGLQQVSSRNSWESLPSTKYEIEQIAESINEKRSFWASLIGGGTSKILTNEEATEARFKNESLNKYKYLHLATHAFTSEANEGRAGIVFYPDKEGSEDGILYTEEIYGLTLRNKLVVLSACETGTGEVRTGEGIIGLSRAFQYAGAENLLVSLWNVEDRSTARLMISFYNQLQNGTQPAGALRSAKKELIEASPYAHPRYWAPFIFTGN